MKHKISLLVVIFSLVASLTLAQEDKATVATPLQLVIIGDSTSNADKCPGCDGYVEQYAAELESRTGRTVEISRIDALWLLHAVSLVTANPRARDEIAAADVVIVAVGYNNVIPDPEYTVSIAEAAKRPPEEMGCLGDPGESKETVVAWLLTNTPECLQAQVDAAAEMYDTVFGTITELRAGAPSVLLALNAYDGNLGDPFWQNIDVSAATMTDVNQWILDAYERWNPVLCDAATRHGFTCVDVLHALNGPGGTIALGDLSIDGTHLSQSGHDLIAGLLADVDTAQLGVLP